MEFIEFLWVLGYFLVVLGGIYRYFVNDFDYFLDQSIAGPTPVPVFGNWWNSWYKTKLSLVQLERQKTYGRIYGTFDGRTPNLVVADPSLINKVLIKDFDSFVNRVPMMDMKNQYANSMLIALKNYKWKDTKNALTPSFSPENLSKVRGLVQECASDLIKHLNKRIEERYRFFELRSTMTWFALEVASSCGFGKPIEAFDNPTDPFVTNAGRLLNNDELPANPIVILTALYPSLAKLIPSSAFREIHFFAKTARIMVEQKRKETPSEKRHDFLDLMLASHADTSIVLNPLKNDVILAAQVLQFLMAGTDTVGCVLTNLVHNLVMNEEVQDKLRSEILCIPSADTEIQYEALDRLPYLEQCVMETLRMAPPITSIDRECSKTTVCNGVKMQKGTYVTIPIYAIHQDPAHYPKPDIFDPERFSPAEIKTRDPMTFLPFGSGPRSCIGAKFAMQQIKIAVCHLLSNFKFTRILQTPETAKILPGIVPCFKMGKTNVGLERLSSSSPISLKTDVETFI